MITHARLHAQSISCQVVLSRFPSIAVLYIMKGNFVYVAQNPTLLFLLDLHSVQCTTSSELLIQGRKTSLRNHSSWKGI